MKILTSWLREFVDFKADAQTLARDLTMAGISVEAIEKVGGEAVFSMEITTNRPDAMNHYGVAREVAAIYDRPLKPIVATLPKSVASPKSRVETPDRASQARPKLKFEIKIEDKQGCARYTSRILRGVTIGPSPKKIAERLEANDSRPINSAADATNYNLIEMGHPTHAFDLDTLEGGRLIVRRARAGEKLKTLDGVDRNLTPEDLVIADARKPVALAGVMGGFDTMITERTKNVLIEAAWFDPATVRAMSRRHGMHTDASHRFERGADWGATSLAAARVAQLILEGSGGSLDGGEIEAVGRHVKRPMVRLRPNELVRHLGQEIPPARVTSILKRLGFYVAIRPLWTVEVPTWRLDVEREIDLIEELARIYGYNNFENTLPGFSGSVVELPTAEKEDTTRRTLLALGYHEAMTYSFISHADAGAFSGAQAIELANPLNEELSVMRTSLVPGMLEMLAHNLNRDVKDVRLFEAGHVFELKTESLAGNVNEVPAICLGATGDAATGNAAPASVHAPARAYTFFDMKGDLEALLAAFEHKALYFDANAPAYYHPGRSARAVMDGETVARFGQIILPSEVAAKRKLKQDVFIAEVFADRLYRRALREPRYAPLSKFPAVERDFSFLMPDDVSFERIRSAVDALHIPALRSFAPAEIFRGGSVSAGKQSLLLRAVFQSSDRTLRDDEVAAWSQRIVQSLTALGGTLRS
ncbi:MAG: phenylalanine--tRNA ligase subunit beta [Candidatus Koribacter versatilis]|uniref:Phenylalanine--tRNA ligase beta subunit n=1 Tax=Candidatus Korobacter versatilis TaxID=658062 RepID=A0A932AAE2_9BACT|nr:phenylalanine--tRNA ligase subunit beta [Candidatus Koribacter versatilis]